MGFREAIKQSGWGRARQHEARRLCGELRKSLRCGDYPPDADQVYKNLDADPLIPDTPPPRRPASRLALLEELLRTKPDPDGGLKAVANEFCHNHKMEGQEDPAAAGHILGRLWTRKGLNSLYQKPDRLGSRRSPSALDRILAVSLEDQQHALGDMRLAPERVTVMWSFYDPRAPGNPLLNLPKNRAAAVDILGLGEYYYRSPNEPLVQWGHRLPVGEEAKRATAWDGGVRNPYWRPGGRTRPLSADGGGTGKFTPADGLPEVTHSPVTGRDLALRIALVAD